MSGVVQRERWMGGGRQSLTHSDTALTRDACHTVLGVCRNGLSLLLPCSQPKAHPDPRTGGTAHPARPHILTERRHSDPVC